MIRDDFKEEEKVEVFDILSAKKFANICSRAERGEEEGRERSTVL